jgi:hypothetical protein
MALSASRCQNGIRYDGEIALKLRAETTTSSTAEQDEDRRHIACP